MTTHADAYAQINRVRADAIRGLTDQGVSQADIARQLDVSRQAVQKMLAP